MRRPARVRDPRRSMEWLGLQLPREVLQLALGAAANELAILDRADPGRIITAIFEALQTIEQALRDVGIPDDPDNSAHYSAAFRVIRSRKRLAQPAIPLCSLRSTARLSASTSAVMTDPAPMIAPSPTVTRATSAVFEPMKAPAPITVRYLPNPS